MRPILDLLLATLVCFARAQSTLTPAPFVTAITWRPQDITYTRMSTQTPGQQDYTVPYPYSPFYPSQPTGQVGVTVSVDLVSGIDIFPFGGATAYYTAILFRDLGGNYVTESVASGTVPITTFGPGPATLLIPRVIWAINTMEALNRWTYQIQIHDQFNTLVSAYQFYPSFSSGFNLDQSAPANISAIYLYKPPA